MKTTENELKLLNSILDHKENVEKAQAYIKENFGVNTKYNEDSNTINIWTSNINESLQLLAAKEYIEREIGLDSVNVKYGVN